jgi:hypothetical protein
MAPREAAPAGLLPLYLAIGALFAALGLWVLLAAPQRNLNRALAAVLLLWAGSSIVFQLMRDATSAETYSAYRAAASLYEVPTPFLFLYIVDELFLPKPRSRARRAALAGLAAFALLIGAAFLAHDWAGETTRSAAPGGGPLTEPTGASLFQAVFTLVPSLQAVAIFLAESAAVIVAAHAAGKAPPGSIERRRAAALAIAFGFLTGHNAGTALGIPFSPNFLAVASDLGRSDFFIALAQATGLLAAAYAWPRVAAAWEGRARSLALACVVLPFFAGFLDYARDTFAPGFSAGLYVNTRVVWVSAFAIGIAVVVLRYDLAVVGAQRSARRAAATGALLAFGVAGIGAGYVLSALDATPLGLTVAGVILATPAALALPRRVSGLLRLDTRDPALDRERARTYAAALRAGPGRGVDDTGLRALRAELGLTARDHDLLLSVVEETRETLAPGRLLLSRYRIVRELGRGGFGEAFLARDERAGRDVVLKRLVGEHRRDAAALRRFQREMRLAATLRHPTIVGVEGVERVGDEPYLVMEYMSGGSLADRLRTGGVLSEADATRLASDVLAALAALHARGIVHRDVKPSNILLGATGTAKLGDFTIAKEAVSGETVGGTGGLVGTIAYMAPEQARGLPATPRSDLYALGATLYEALAGRPPIDVEGLGEFEACLKVVQQAPKVPLAGASPRINNMLRRALAKDPADRFDGAEEMARALQAEAPSEAPRRRVRA